MIIIIEKFPRCGWRVTTLGEDEPTDVGHYWANSEAGAFAVLLDLATDKLSLLKDKKKRKTVEAA